jgi:chaperone BCS1
VTSGSPEILLLTRTGRIDGVTAPEGRLLFATTNHIERLDPALSRPGRMDVWVNFKNATRWQAEGIFKRFFPCKTSSPDAATETPDTSVNTTLRVRKKNTSTLPLLEEEELEKLAKEFASNIPEDEVSVAGLQGYLLRNKARPRECVKEVAKWIVQERETKEKIKKEKQEVGLDIPNRYVLALTYRIQREKIEKEEKEKREKEKKIEEDKKAEEAAVQAAAEARRALKKARRAAAAAVVSATPASETEALPTPPPETATPVKESAKKVESESSSTETTTDDTDSESDDAEVATIKEAAMKDKKEKWVSVKQLSTNDSKAEEKGVNTAQSAVTAEKEEADVEDTSAVDALVDAATTKSAVETASA